ncbi:MAG TPA: beta-N-acetylhexosaminidase [Terriglobales bacterium]|nr:beta-N-acetylhexosaminidase [Terriglobales bacterium]
MVQKSSLELQQQVGQMLIMGFDGLEMGARLRTMLSSLQPGGVILFRRNIDSADQTYSLVQECRKSISTPSFLCVDLEGGAVDRFRDLIAPAPSVNEVTAAGNRQLFRKHGQLLGRECRAFGFNTDFAPVLDLGLEASKQVLTTRTVSADPRKVVVYARELLKGLKDVGILGSGKHFPGLGEASLDTHHAMPKIVKPWKRLWEEDLYPYRTLVHELPFVMVAHAAYPGITKNGTPASISRKWITDILRKKIGYKGLIAADDLEMGGVQAAASIEEAAVETVRAGSDIFLVCHKEELVWRCHGAVLKTAETDRRFRELVRTASKRILSVKKRSPELKMRPPRKPEQKTLDQLRRAVWEFSEEVRLDAEAPRIATQV